MVGILEGLMTEKGAAAAGPLGDVTGVLGVLGAGYWLSWPRRFLDGESPPAPPFAEKYFTPWTVYL